MRITNLLWSATCATVCTGAPALAADWRTLPSPAGMQAMLDMDSITSGAGMQQMLIRREFSTLRATAQGAPFRSMRVNYDIDCATKRVSPTLTAWYGDDRRLITSERQTRIPRGSLPAPAPGSDIAEAVNIACERLAANTPVAPVDVPPVQRGDTSGSGIVVTMEGHIVTNQHVVQQCGALEVSDENNQTHRAQLLAADTWRDLALLKVERHFTQAARVRNDAAPKLGESVTVVGYPLAGMLGSKPTVGFGNVSAATGINDNPAQMQISVPIQRGNSGGPVFDQAGHVIGVVASKLDALKVAESVGDLPQNVNFAIRGDSLRAFLDAQRVAYVAATDAVRLENTELAARGVGVTVRVRCARGLP